MSNKETEQETPTAAEQTTEVVEKSSASQKEMEEKGRQIDLELKGTTQPEENKESVGSDGDAKPEPLPVATAAAAEQSNKARASEAEDGGGGGGWGWGGWGKSLWSSVSTVTESAQALGQKVCRC